MDDEFATLHADFRLLQRTREFDKSLTELWESGIDCEVRYHGYDEARLVPSHDVVMLVEDGQVVTILDNLHNVTLKGDEFQDYLAEAIDE